MSEFLGVLTLPRVWLSALFSLIGLALLLRARVDQPLRLAALAVMFLVFGTMFLLPLGKFAAGMGPHPSPMCIVTKPFLFVNAGRAVPIVFLALLFAVAVLSLVGNKLFCGWVCPIGALQEICHRIPLPGGLKIKLPFRVTNLVRVILFVLYLVLVFSVGVATYDYLNPFEFLHWRFQPAGIFAVAVILVAGMFVFRPFCYLICPLGLLTWFLERVAIFKVRINRQKCTNCNICVKLSPCPAIKPILDGSTWRPDCHPCGRCLEVCPERALEFRA